MHLRAPWHRIAGRLFLLAGLITGMASSAYAGPAGTARPVKLIARLLENPRAVAVDARGNLYLLTTDPIGEEQVVREAADGTDSTVLASGLLVWPSLAVDARGVVYLVDNSHGQVLAISATGARTVLAGGFASPSGVAVDGAGTVYTVDTGTKSLIAISSAGKRRVVPARLDGFGPLIGNGAFLAVDRQGNVYVTVQSSSLVLRVASGTGKATALHTGRFTNSNIAVDSGGDLYLTDSNWLPPDPNRDRVVKLAPSGRLSTVASGLLGPEGVAVDAAGNVYIADTQHSRVVEVPAGGGPQVTVGLGLAQPISLAVDRAGNLYILDQEPTGALPQGTNPFYTSRLVRLSPSGAAKTLIDGLLAATDGALAVDRDGNVYVADQGHNRVLRLAAGSGAATVVGGTLRKPTNVALDDAGTLYVTSITGTHGAGNNITTDLEVVRIAAGVQRVVFTQSHVPTPVFGLPLTTDTKGNLYITTEVDASRLEVLELPGGTGAPVALPGVVGLVIGADAQDNLYLVSGRGGANALLELPAHGGAPLVVETNIGDLGSGAVDRQGNIYMAADGLVQEYEARGAQG